MKVFSLVSMSMIAVSFAIPFSVSKEAESTIPDLASAEVHHQINKSEESKHPKSFIDFEEKLEQFSDKLLSCAASGTIDLKCFRSAQASIIALSEEAKSSDLSPTEKETMRLSLVKFSKDLFPWFQRSAEKQCIHIQHFTTDCIYFNFENYAAAVEVFQRFAKYEFQRALNYEKFVQGAKEVFLDALRSSIDEFRRLSEVPTEQWLEKVGIREVMDSFFEAKKLHQETIAILEAKGVGFGF